MDNAALGSWMGDWDPDASLRTLSRWAERIGVHLEAGQPLSSEEIAAIPRTYRPHFGALKYVPPPSYAAFLSRCGSLVVRVPIGDSLVTWNGLGVYAPKQAAKLAREVVFVPEGVAFDERPISTNHLVCFAPHELSPDLTTCFVTDPDARGELPVIVHDQDEPAFARYLDGAPIEPSAWKELEHWSFGEWLDARVAAAVKLSIEDLEI